MDFFPLGLAQGQAFCNRVNEREKLSSNIKLNRNTLIISPRRYGKSSLALYVLQEMDVPYVRVDLFLTMDESSMVRAILTGVNNLLNRIISKPMQAIALVKDIIKHLAERWSIGTDGVELLLTRREQSEDALAIKEALFILEQLLAKQKRKAVFFIDEFQEISSTKNSRAIEGAIRNVAEKNKHLAFVFSGSNRHILSNIFDDRARPLYMLCDKIILERIAKGDYKKFIDDIAKQRWGESPLNDFYEQLFTLR